MHKNVLKLNQNQILKKILILLKKNSNKVKRYQNKNRNIDLFRNNDFQLDAIFKNSQ